MNTHDIRHDDSASLNGNFVNEAETGQGPASSVKVAPPQHVERLAQELGKLVGPFLANKPPTHKRAD
ncbi:MAG: hypothetical protein WD894_14855 [Pirellulales bacterium]